MSSQSRSRSRKNRFRRQTRSRFSTSRSRSMTRFNKSNYVTRVPWSLGFIAPRQICRLKYSETISLTIAAALGQADYLFRLNSIFDPNKTGTGHQPYGTLQLSTLYNRYRVFKTYWRITIPATNEQLHFAVLPVNNTHTFTTVDEAAEYPRAVTKSISFNGGQVTTFKGHVYLPRLNGCKVQEYKTDDRFEAVMSANPVEVMDLHMVISNPQVTANAIEVNPLVTIMYVVEVYDPPVQAQS